MPYTLMKGLLWILAAVVIGIVVGWLLRSVAAKRQIARARDSRLDPAEHDELLRLRTRVANLEPIVNERDRLRAELDRARPRPGVDVAPAAFTTSAAEDAPASAPSAHSAASTTSAGPSTPAPRGGNSNDARAASAALGRRVAIDDLTVIEGIGPKIAELCHGIGIRTWADLAETEASLLKTMLTDAGQRFKAHDPSTWPEQAGLLAAGAWDEFRALTDRLDGGRAVD